MAIEDEYLDVLQNIESGIVVVYRSHPEMSDWDALGAVEELIRVYRAEERGREVSIRSLSPLSQEVFNSVRSMCEWRLGREHLSDEDGTPVELGMPAKSLDEIIACLKRIRKSIEMWHKERGVRGYLDFVSQFV